VTLFGTGERVAGTDPNSGFAGHSGQ